jgi:hypothetical protein
MLDMCCAVRDIDDRSEVIGMAPLALTMTLSELNRLCGAYYDAIRGKDPKVAEEAWLQTVISWARLLASHPSRRLDAIKSNSLLRTRSLLSARSYTSHRCAQSSAGKIQESA